MFEKVEGIVLKTQDYGETHKIVTLFTREKGKFAVIARGAKKTKSRMAAITQPFVYATFLVQMSSSLGTLQQGEILHSMRSIREDIEKTAYAAFMAELTDKLLDQKKPSSFLFEQFLDTLEKIAAGEDAQILVMMYQMKMFHQGGFAPEVRHCVQCGTKENLISFSIREGGILCTRCRMNDTSSIQLPENLIKMLQIFLYVGVSRLGQVSVKKESKKVLQDLLDNYYDQYGGFYLKSKKFLKQLELLE